MWQHERSGDQSLLTWSGPAQLWAPGSEQSVSHGIVSLLLLALLLLAGTAHAGIVEDVRDAVSRNNFTLAGSMVQKYEAQRGATPELSEATSWIGRGALGSQQLDLAERYARQTESLVTAQLKSRSLDADQHLPLALGAALEVQAQVLAKRGEKQEAIALLERSLQSYGSTSIRARLQKNLNLLALVGQAAPALQADRYLHGTGISLASLKGSPVLLFFWAHWCGDCKYEAPIITQLRSEFETKGLRVIAPTQLYGYAARGEDAQPEIELAWIDKVRQRLYADLLDVPVPVSKANFDTYGVSTTPTLVVVDRQGNVSLYHPGVMSYADLRAALEHVVAN